MPEQTERFIKHRYDPPLETLEELSAAVEELRQQAGDDADLKSIRVAVNYRGRVRGIEVTS